MDQNNLFNKDLAVKLFILIELVFNSASELKSVKEQDYDPFVGEQNNGNGYWKQGAIYSRLTLNNFPEIKNTQLAFDYLALNKRVEFIDETNAKFEDWISTIWDEIQSLSLNETYTDQACVYCEKNYQ